MMVLFWNIYNESASKKEEHVLSESHFENLNKDIR